MSALVGVKGHQVSSRWDSARNGPETFQQEKKNEIPAQQDVTMSEVDVFIVIPGVWRNLFKCFEIATGTNQA